MGATGTSMETMLAASMARLNESIEQMKQIAERSKSTDATLARIARIQASWEPREQVVQESKERRWNSITLSGVQVACTEQSAVIGPIPAYTERKGCLDMSARRLSMCVSAAPTSKSTTSILSLQTTMAQKGMFLDTAATPHPVNMYVVADPPLYMSTAH